MRPAVKIAVLMLTPACDMACPYCGAASSFRDMTEKEVQDLVLDLAARGCESVVFGGGEPFCWKGDLRVLCAFAQRAGLLTRVGSNLLRLPVGAARWPEVDRWVVPFESASSAAHNALRPSAGSHQATVLRALQGFRDAGASVTVSSVARLGAEADLHSVADLLHAWVTWGLKLHAWHVYRFQPQGRGGEMHTAQFAQSDEAWEALAATLKARYKNLPLLLRPDLYHSRQVAFISKGPRGLWQQGPLDWRGLALSPEEVPAA